MRARNIKPSLFKNEFLGTADPILTILFTGLWCLADKEGRLEDRPLRIKAELFPYRENLNVNGYLTELASLEFICRYTINNRDYIQVNNFKKHQAPHKTEKSSEIPEPPKTVNKSDSCSLTVKAPLSNAGLTAPLPSDSLIPDSIRKTPVFVSDLDFEKFYKTYPKNTGAKKKAREAINKALKNGVAIEKIIDGAGRYAKYLASMARPPHTAHASTWVNEERWETDYSISGKGSYTEGGIEFEDYQPMEA